MTAAAALRRLEYLEQTSLALALVAPSTSAVLGAEASRLRAETGLADGAGYSPQSLRCPACDAILIPGWSNTVSLEPGIRSTKRLSKRRRISAPSSHSGASRDFGEAPTERDHSIKSVCLRCHHDVQKPLLKVGKGREMSAQDTQNGRSHASQPSAGDKDLELAHGSTDPVAPTDTRLPQGDSRKTTRKRRKGGGLGSLLAQGRTKTHPDARGNNTLGLMDFLIAE